MSFLDLSVNAQGAFNLWVLMIQFLLIYNFLGIAKIGKKKTNIRCILLIILNFALYQVICQKMRGETYLPFTPPVLLLTAVCLLLTVLAVTEQVRIIRWRRNHVTDESVKEALDALPTGLCYALPGGLPLLINERMAELGKKLFGDPAFDANEAWRKLEENEVTGRLIQGGPEPIYELTDGRAYSFRRSEMQLAEGLVTAIIATDVTREFAMMRELEEKQRRVRVVNARLKSLLGTIEYVTMSRELLQLKIAMHDNLGRALLMTKRYLIRHGAVKPTDILTEWRRNLQHLIGEEPEPWQIPYYVIGQEAATLGIELQIIGELPQEERLLPVIDQAISAHVINVLKHADGHVAYIEIFRDNKKWRISFTNDGKLPQGPILETGGLKSLRKNVEGVGGEMQISGVPRFEMILWLPAGDGQSAGLPARDGQSAEILEDEGRKGDAR